jgi:hypothetical protein
MTISRAGAVSAALEKRFLAAREFKHRTDEGGQCFCVKTQAEVVCAVGVKYSRIALGLGISILQTEQDLGCAFALFGIELSCSVWRI